MIRILNISLNEAKSSFVKSGIRKYNKRRRKKFLNSLIQNHQQLQENEEKGKNRNFKSVNNLSLKYNKFNSRSSKLVEKGKSRIGENKSQKESSFNSVYEVNLKKGTSVNLPSITSEKKYGEFLQLKSCCFFL